MTVQPSRITPDTALYSVTAYVQIREAFPPFWQPASIGKPRLASAMGLGMAAVVPSKSPNVPRVAAGFIEAIRSSYRQRGLCVSLLENLGAVEPGDGRPQLLGGSRGLLLRGQDSPRRSRHGQPIQLFVQCQPRLHARRPTSGNSAHIGRGRGLGNGGRFRGTGRRHWRRRDRRSQVYGVEGR